jgi:hypothetical protein
MWRSLAYTCNLSVCVLCVQSIVRCYVCVPPCYSFIAANRCQHLSSGNLNIDTPTQFEVHSTPKDNGSINKSLICLDQELNPKPLTREASVLPLCHWSPQYSLCLESIANRVNYGCDCFINNGCTIFDSNLFTFSVACASVGEFGLTAICSDSSVNIFVY